MGQGGGEDDAVLPGLAAMRQRDQAGSLELVQRGKELIEALGLLGNAGLLEGGLGEPEPAHVVDVDRRGVEVAFHLDGLQHGLGQELVPAIALGHRVDVVQIALLDDVAELLGGVELRGGRRVAAGNAVDGDRAGLLTQRDGGVHPDAALGLVGLGQGLDRGRLPARGPPVDDLGLEWLGRLGRLGRGRQGGGQRGGGQEAAVELHLVSGSVGAAGRSVAPQPATRLRADPVMFYL
mmetsp:Transcript_5758/g.22369  ORF Transcript_5758/g.22369 Transcript_5758/m.22369 type:complete len:236 (+) Transcript_5758:2518-3225(+)